VDTFVGAATLLLTPTALTDQLYAPVGNDLKETVAVCTPLVRSVSSFRATFFRTPPAFSKIKDTALASAFKV
jgi:hypothetical protein